MMNPQSPSPAVDPSAAAAEPADLLDDRPTRLILLAIMVVAMAFSLWYCASSPVDPDELEHLHSAWLWQQGVQPYTGFFESHPPLFWVVLRPLFGTVADRDLVGLVHHARVLTWFISALTLVAGWRLFRAAFGQRAAWCGGALLAVYLALTPHALHVRPDMFSLMLLLFGTALAIEGFGWGCPACCDSQGGQTPSWRRSLLAGVLIAASVCALPKTVFWAFAVGAALAVGTIARAIRGDRKLLPPLAMLAGGAATSAGLQLAWIVLANNMAAFWECNVVANRHAAISLLKYPLLLGEVTRMAFSWPMLSAPLGIIGLAGVLASGGWSGAGRKSIVVLMLLTSMVLVLLGLPFAQYQLPLHVVLGGLAGAGLSIALRTLSVRVARYALLGLAGVSLLWLALLLAIPASFGRQDDTLHAMQAALDHSTKDDTYVALQHWNPVFMMDTDPTLYATYMVRHDRPTFLRLLELIHQRKPKFVVGFGVPMLEDGRMVPVQLLEAGDAIFLRSYAPMNPPSPVVLERQE